VARERWGWGAGRASVVAAIFLAMDLAFFGANLIKIEHGGWFPLLVAALVYTVMATWHRGRRMVVALLDESEVPLEAFFAGMKANPPARVPGTAIFMTARAEGAPPILVHHLKHTKALHERIILFTVEVLDVPVADPENSIDVEDLGAGFFRVIARYGFMQPVDAASAMRRARRRGLELIDEDTTYFLAHLTLLVSSRHRGLTAWRDKLFVFLSRNARRATNFFRVPPDRVVEIGIQLEI
jgi:KUP system potassium uptake protein